MKCLSNTFLAFLIALMVPLLGATQDSSAFDLSYNVHRNYPAIEMTKEKLMDARSLSDINKHYPSSWIKEYNLVTFQTKHQGNTRKATSKDSTLTTEQKDLLLTADPGAPITVNVQYLPNNNLSHNEPKEISFTFTVEPEIQASFTGGQQQLRQYLKEKAMDNIAEDHFNKYQMTAVRFTIDEEGQVLDPLVFWSSEDKEIDQVLLETVCNMPRWKPAEYANGKKIKQEFVFTVGDMESCVVNMFNIKGEGRNK